jgi:hypothetical protein
VDVRIEGGKMTNKGSIYSVWCGVIYTNAIPNEIKIVSKKEQKNVEDTVSLMVLSAQLLAEKKWIF